MRDPKPENIGGEKRRTVAWNINVDVGQVMLGLAGLALAILLWRRFSSSDSQGDGETARAFVYQSGTPSVDSGADVDL